MAGEYEVDPSIRRQLRTRDQVAANLANEQQGRVARWQLVELGVGARAIDRSIAAGRLHIEHRGVYMVGHRVETDAGRWIAAVLAFRGAVLSHVSAAALWGLLRPERVIHVTVAKQVPARDGIRVHCSQIPDADITRRDNIPVTTVARTLRDLAAAAPQRHLQRAMREAITAGLMTTTEIDPLDAAVSSHRGAASLRRAAVVVGESRGRTRSDFEEEFQEYAKRHRLKRHRLNMIVEGYECDCVWPEARLIVELDTRTYHDDPFAFESDRRKDRQLRVAGWTVTRVVPAHLQDAALVRELRGLGA